MYNNSSSNQGCGSGLRMGIAAVVALVAIVGYFRNSSVNPITGAKQHVAISADQEIALGLQAAPEMLQQYGGEDPDPNDVALVNSVGEELRAKSDAGTTSYKFVFHCLADDRTVNAFALPGGQVFITRALLHKLKTRGQLAGVLGHEMGHVAARHGAQQMAKQQLTQGLTGAALIATYDSRDSRSRAAMAIMVAQLVNLKYSRDDESEADKLGVRFMSQSGYDPRAMLGVMQVLKAEGGGGSAEFFQTHPNPDHRIERIKSNIAERFPRGLPAGMKP
jgi:beta-barrel assembly-enhancing protease